MITSSPLSEASWQALGKKVSGEVIVPASTNYDLARRVWNGAIDRRPAAIVQCLNANDVLEAVAWAQRHDLPVSVRGGGHDVKGRAIVDGGLVIDCSWMKKVEVDTERCVATAQAGARVGDLVDAVQAHGMVAATGTMSLVGMAGLTLGGGYGPLIGQYGLVADNLVGARLVTASGAVLNVNEQNHADLLWALRGGGGNFGVVVEFDYSIHPAPTLLSGLLFYSLDQAPAVLRTYARLLEDVPDALTVEFAFVTSADGKPAFLLSPTYCGDLAVGRELLEELKQATSPLLGEIGETSYAALVRSVDQFGPAGRNYHIRSQSLLHLDEKSIEILMHHAGRMTSPYSMIAAHHFHGRASQIGPAESAFSFRKDHLMIEVCAAWDAPENAAPHREWADACSTQLETVAAPGGYINFLDEAEEHRVQTAMGDNLERLIQLKRKYDPRDVFHHTMGHIALAETNR